jgi:hypothetical protein
MLQALREEERRLIALLTKRSLQVLVLLTVLAVATTFTVAAVFGIAHAVGALLVLGSAAAIVTRP